MLNKRSCLKNASPALSDKAHPIFDGMERQKQAKKGEKMSKNDWKTTVLRCTSVGRSAQFLTHDQGVRCHAGHVYSAQYGNIVDHGRAW